MEEETTTDATVDTSGVQTINGIAVDDSGQAIPQLDDTDNAPAVPTEPTEQPEEQTEVSTEVSVDVDDEPSEDDQLVKFAQAKGLELDSDNAKKAAKMAMNAEKLMHQKSQQASQLEKATKITDDQVPVGLTAPEADSLRVRNLELKYEVSDWKSRNPDKLKYESEMVQVLSDPTKRLLVQEGLLTLDDVYSIAKATAPGVEAALKSQGKKEALQTLAHKQQAAVPRGNAVTAVSAASQITPQNVDAMVANMSVEEYRRRLPEINAALAN